MTESQGWLILATLWLMLGQMDGGIFITGLTTAVALAALWRAWHAGGI